MALRASARRSAGPGGVADRGAPAAGAAWWPTCNASWRPGPGPSRRWRRSAASSSAARNLGDIPARDLKGLAETIGKQIESPGVVALVSTAEGKASIVVGVSADLTGRFSAVDLVRAASCGGGRQGRRRATRPGAGGRAERGRRGRRDRRGQGNAGAAAKIVSRPPKGVVGRRSRRPAPSSRGFRAGVSRRAR